MKYKRSTLLGSGIVLVVLLISILVFHLNQGPCPVGFFSCDNDTKCILNRNVCNDNWDCDDEADESFEACFDFSGTARWIHRSLGALIREESDIEIQEQSNYTNCQTELGECECVVKNFSNILYCHNLYLKAVPKLRDRKMNINHFYLENNSIILSDGSFEEYGNISNLHLNNNSIEVIPDGSFQYLSSLRSLYLEYNNIYYIEPGAFKGLYSLESLFLRNNKLTSISISNLPNLLWLDLDNNNITNFAIQDFPSLREIFLNYNKITKIDKDTIKRLPKLWNFEADFNEIDYIDPMAFRESKNLLELRFSYNKIKVWPKNFCENNPELNRIHLDNNPVVIEKDSFDKCENITSLNIDGINAENIDFSAFKNLKNLSVIHFKKFQYCAFVPHVKKCKPNTDGISSLTELVSKPALRPAAWMVAILTIIGNTLVLCGRATGRDENRALSLVIRNLAVSDMLMGVYLLVIGIQDTRFRNEYDKYAQEWISSWTCVWIGATAMTSSVVSLLILTFMSVERFLLIVDPLGGHPRLTTRIAKLAMITLWTIGISLAVIPIMYWRTTTRFYGMYNGMCFPLHLMEKFPLGWQYSTFIFVGINSLGLVIVAGVYCAMFISVLQTRRAVLSSNDCEFAIRFFFIVLTNAACWAPVVCFKIATFFNVEISTDLYAYMVVFILPLNSAVNPLLYTFTTPKYRDQLLSFTWKYSVKRASMGGETESSRTSSSKNIVCAIVSRNNSNMKLDSTLTNFTTSTTSVDYKL